MSDIRKAIMARLGEFARPGAKAAMSKATDALEYIKNSIASGKTVYVTAGNRTTKVTPQSYAKWEASGKPLFKISSDGALLMASGSSYVRLTLADEMLARVTAMSRPGAKAKFGYADAQVVGGDIVWPSGMTLKILSHSTLEQKSKEMQDAIKRNRSAWIADYKLQGPKGATYSLDVYANGTYILTPHNNPRPMLRGQLKMSRLGAKAEFDRRIEVDHWTSPKGTKYVAGVHERGGGTSFQPFISATYSDGGEQLMTGNAPTFKTEKGARKWLDTEIGRRKSVASRPGAKAEMRESLQAMWDGKQWKVTTPSGAAWYSEDGKRWTKKHGEPVTPAEVRQYAIKLGTGFSRLGEKAAFASKRTTAGALRKQLKAQGITDAAELEWHGIPVSDPDSTPYWLHEDGSMEKIKSSRPGTKAAMGYSTIRKVTTTDVVGGGTWRKTMEKYGTKKAAVMTYTNNGQVGQVYQDPDNPSVFKAFDMDGRELGSGSEADMKRKVESLAFAKTGSKSTHASLWNRFTVVLRSKRTGNRLLWNTEAKNEADAKDNAYALYGDAYEVIEVAMRPSRPGAKSTNALSDACWQGYEAVGTKKQDGKTVPNCVPKATMGRAEQVMRDGSVHLDFKAAEEWLSGVTESALRYIIDDARKAAKAMPDGNKFNYYHDLSLTAQDELRKRQSKKSKATATKPERKAKNCTVDAKPLAYGKGDDALEREDVKAGLKLMEKADPKVSEKIRTLIKEGKPQDQAVASALDMKRRGEL